MVMFNVKIYLEDMRHPTKDIRIRAGDYTELFYQIEKVIEQILENDYEDLIDIDDLFDEMKKELLTTSKYINDEIELKVEVNPNIKKVFRL